MGRGLDRFFDEVYLPSTRGLFSERLTAQEAGVIERLLSLRTEGRYLDLGCGHGRHVAALHARGLVGVVGVDRSAPALRAARESVPGGAFVRGDFRALPFGEGVFDGAFDWYSGLFVSPEDEHPGILAEVLRVLRPGAVMVHDGANPARLARQPEARYQGTGPGGCSVEERCTYDRVTGWERGWRRVRQRDGREVEGRWGVRHYTDVELVALLAGVGYEVDSLLDEQGRDYDADRSLDLVVVARRPLAGVAEGAQRR